MFGYVWTEGVSAVDKQQGGQGTGGDTAGRMEVCSFDKLSGHEQHVSYQLQPLYTICCLFPCHRLQLNRPPIVLRRCFYYILSCHDLNS